MYYIYICINLTDMGFEASVCDAYNMSGTGRLQTVGPSYYDFSVHIAKILRLCFSGTHTEKLHIA